MLQHPLWKQLAVVWLGAVLLSSLLLRLELRRPYKFFWLIPYPSWRTVTSMIVQFFRRRPLSATAVIGVPAAAMVVSLALIGIAAARSRTPDNASGVSVSREQSNDR